MQQLPTADRRAGGAYTGRSRGRTLIVVAAVSFLAACSAIPQQPVNDPLGLDSMELALTFVGATSAGAGSDFGAQAVAGEFTDTFTFDDWDVELPVNPGTLTNDVSIASASLEPATSADAPMEIVLSEPLLTIQLWQGADSYQEAGAADRVEYVLEAEGAITLARGTCAVDSRCSYSYQGADLAFGTVKLSGNPLGNLIRIATSEPTPNSGSVSLSVQGEPDALAGKTLNIRLDAAEGSVGF